MEYTGNCKSCDKPVRVGTHHEKCAKAKMNTTRYVDPKMSLDTYPVEHIAPAKEETREEQYSALYKVLGAAQATQWMLDNVYSDIDVVEEFHKLMEGEIEC